MDTHSTEKKFWPSHKLFQRLNSPYDEIFKRIEDEVLKLEVEIQHLENISEESQQLLDSMRYLLKQKNCHTVDFINDEKIEVDDLRERIKQRRLELCRLQRRLKLSKLSSKRRSYQIPHNSISVKTLIGNHQIHQFGTKLKQTDEYEALDVEDTFDVASKEIIKNMKFSKEEDFMNFEKRRIVLREELKEHRSMEMAQREQTNEVIEEVKSALQIHRKHLLQFDRETEQRKRILGQVKTRLHRICLLLKTMNDGQLVEDDIDKASVTNILSLMIRKMKTALHTFENTKVEGSGCNIAVAVTSCLMEEGDCAMPEIVQNEQEEGEEDDDEYEDVDEIDYS